MSEMLAEWSKFVTEIINPEAIPVDPAGGSPTRNIHAAARPGSRCARPAVKITSASTA